VEQIEWEGRCEGRLMRFLETLRKLDSKLGVDWKVKIGLFDSSLSWFPYSRSLYIYSIHDNKPPLDADKTEIDDK
jgi:hypothetical protein